MARCRCGATEGVHVYPMWPRKLFLCRSCAADHFKTRRRQETARLLAQYGDVDQTALRAEAHHVALRAEAGAVLACAPQPGALEPAAGTLLCTPQPPDDVGACLDALAAQAVRYFREFEGQAYRVFPSYRDRQRARGHAVRAAKRAVYALPYDVPWLRRLYRDRCAYCGGTAAHIDHVWPLVLGGDDAPWNLATACADCNLSKGGRALGGWLPGRLDELTDDQRAAVRELWRTWTPA
ncbi:HNH endonuclease [Amycolatopsis sulphurea]|uniref:HNH endonuclease n=1 Tax=Amycolatopsis sulphurea TaxID=76022 RepID=A0A2A9F9J5_9PSEU|nr:HNH endonuclease signature motif containing protein [Amycolatopsis sulphurea]PFG48097.1 HNH endonuclease [Amycolatopsis sulphurea]